MRNTKLLPLTAAACVIALGQPPGQIDDRKLSFDAAAIKPWVPPTGGRGMIMDRGGRGGPGSTDPGRIHYAAITLKSLLMTAYDVKDFQVSGPNWLDSERFDIQATMPPETTKEQFHIMLQNLLAERFKVTIHRETKELPMYSMVVGKNGPKMKESAEALPADDSKDPTPPPAIPAPGRMKFDAEGFPILPLPTGGRGGLFQIMMPNRARLIAQKQTMQDLANRLSTILSRPVTDATALKPKYDFTLSYNPAGLSSGMGGLGAPPPPPGEGGGRGALNMPDVDPPPDIFTSMQAQLGLKLEPKKGPVDLLVVDHAEKTPTEN